MPGTRTQRTRNSEKGLRVTPVELPETVVGAGAYGSFAGVAR
ncbi:hypothetical protein [Streptomyces sp. NPDC088757]